MTKPVNYVLDQDIEKFFDTVNHRWIIKCLRQRIADKSFLRIIKKFLCAGIMEDGEYIESDKGVPQGGILSPILANIYLHYAIDLWFEKVIKRGLKGYAGYVRYADDFIVCFQRREEAEEFVNRLKERLQKFALRVKDSKSRVIEFGRYAQYRAEREGKKVVTFDFLGFTHYCDKTRSGKFKLGRKTESSRHRRGLNMIYNWIKSIRNCIKFNDWWKMLGIKLRGYYHTMEYLEICYG